MSDKTSLIAQGQALLADKMTSLEKLRDEGWEVEMNMGGVMFLRHKSRAVLSIPHWVMQLRDRAATQATEDARREMRQAIGLEPPDPAQRH